MAVFLPAAAGVSSVCAAAAVLYRFVRPRFPVTVNCWFCNENTSVPYGNVNCWDCPRCDQYNGFSKDNDYNKPIPAQFDEQLNQSVQNVRGAGSEFNSCSNVLCDNCSRNLLLKTRQLANFVPSSEGRYDIEVTAYRQSLEGVYRLCRQCDFRTQQVLEKQTRLLRRTHPGPRDAGGDAGGGRAADVTPPRDARSLHDVRTDSPAASPRLSGRRPLSLVTLLVAVVTFVVVVPPLTAVVAPASWLPASWLPGSWLPGSWLPASWLPASWLPASLRRWVPSPVAGQLGLVAGLLLLLADICQLGIHRLGVRDVAALAVALLTLALHSPLVAIASLTTGRRDALRAAAATVAVALGCWRWRDGRRASRRADIRITTWKKTPPNGEVARSSRSSQASEPTDIGQSFSENDAGPVKHHQSNGNPCFNQFETMNLGSTPTKKRLKPGGMFSPAGSRTLFPAAPRPLSASPSLSSLDALHRRRPIISPARFNAHRGGGGGGGGDSFKRSVLPPVSNDRTNLFARPPSSLSHGRLGMDSSGVFTGGPVSGYAAGDRSSVFSEPRRPADRDDDDVSDAGSSDTNGAPASRRPSVASWRRVTADTTAEATGRTAARGVFGRCGRFAGCLLAVSIGVNAIFVALFIFDIRSYLS